MSRRPYAVALAIVAVAGVVAQVVATTGRPDQAWGFHLYAFFPRPLGILAWIVTIAAAITLLRSSGGGRLALRVGSVVETRPFVSTAIVAAATGAAAWILRSRQTLLGDAGPLVRDLVREPSFHPREPLTMRIQHALHDLVEIAQRNGPGGEELATQAVAIGSVTAGIVFVFVAFALGRLLANEGSVPGERGATALLVAMVVLAQGYCALFFGYLENYTFVALASAAYVVAALRYLRGTLPLVVPIALIVVCIALHMMSIVLLPSLAVLVTRGLGKASRRATLRDLALGAAGFLALDLWIRGASGDSTLLASIRYMLRAGGADTAEGARLAYLLSLPHLRDFLSAQYLIGPLAAFLFVPVAAIAVATHATRGATFAFLVVAGGAPLLAHWTLPDPTLGYARDWDLFAPAGVVMTMAGLSILLPGVKSAAERIRLLAFAWIVSALHLAPWVALNASESRSLARFEQLPLGEGRTQVVLGNWHRRYGRPEKAIEWFEKAIRENPNQNNAYALLGTLHADQGRHDLAAEMHGRAVALRPDKPVYRRHFVDALLAERRFAEALPHSRWLCENEPGEINHWLGWSRALFELGRADEARAVLDRALARFLEIRATDPRGERSNHDVGLVLAGLERYDEAVQAFGHSLAAEPRSERSLFNVAGILIHLGRWTDARPYLERLLELPLEPSRRGIVEGWLEQSVSK